jgi:hypothetical protein
MLSGYLPDEQSSTNQIDIHLFDLVDLDTPVTDRNTIKFSASKTSNVGHVAQFLKWRFCDGPARIPLDHHIEIFTVEKQLHRNEIVRGFSILFYRVSDPEDNGPIQLKWKICRQPWHMRQSQLKELSLGNQIGRHAGATAT